MRPIACVLAVLVAFAQGAAAERMVTDSAGREVAVPVSVERLASGHTVCAPDLGARAV